MEPTEPGRISRAPLILLALAIAASAGFIFWETRGQALYADEFGVLVRYRGIDPGLLLQPQAGNLFVVGILMEKALFSLFGAGSYVPIRVLHVVLASACGVLFFLLARRRVGDWLALAPTVVLLFLGSASEILATPFGGLGLVSIAFGLGMFLALDRGDRVGDGLAAVLLTLSLAAYSIGAAFAVGAFVEVLTRDAVRREKLRSCALLAIPLVLYAIWRLWASKYGNSNFSFANLGELPSSMFTSFAAAVGSVTGVYRDTSAGGSFTLAWARPLAVGLAVLVVLRVRRGAVDRRFWVMLAALLSFWALVALNLGPQRSPEASRYLYLSAIFIFLALLELVRGVRLNRLAIAGIVAAVAASLLANIVTLNESGDQFRSAAQILRGDLSAAEIARDDIDPDTPILEVEPVPVLRDLILPTGAYLSAADKFGSPAYSAQELESAPELAKQSADGQFVRLLGIQPVPDPNPPAPGTGCLAMLGTTSAPSEFRLGAQTIVRAMPGPPVALALSRFSDSQSVNLRALAGGSSARITIPPDDVARPWTLHVSASAGQKVTICTG